MMRLEKQIESVCAMYPSEPAKLIREMEEIITHAEKVLRRIYDGTDEKWIMQSCREVLAKIRSEE